MTGFQRMGDVLERNSLLRTLVDAAPPDRRERIAAALDRLRERIESGVPPHLAIDPIADESECRRCHGTGLVYLHAWMPGEDEPPELIPCGEFCRAGQRTIAERTARARGGSGLEDFTTVTFETTVPTVEQVEIYDYALAYANRPRGLLWLYGTPWSGKTRLAICIGNSWIAAGKPVLYWTEPDLMRDLRETFDRSRNGPSFAAMMRSIQEAPLLLIDDFGKARSKLDPETGQSWVDEKRFEITDHRQIRGLPTVLTSNLTLDDLERHFPRLAPRIFDNPNAHVANLPAIPYSRQTQRSPAPKQDHHATQAPLSGDQD